MLHFGFILKFELAQQKSDYYFDFFGVLFAFMLEINHLVELKKKLYLNEIRIISFKRYSHDVK